MSKSKKKDNFNQAMYEMFGIGKDANVEADVDDEVAEFAGIDPLIDHELNSAVENKQASESKPVHEVPHEPVKEAPVEMPKEAPRTKRYTFLAEGTSIEGTLRCDSDVEICGDFKGDLISNGRVIIHANTNSNVQASDLALVSCNLTGDAKVAKCVSIDANSTITGNIAAAEVVCSGTVRGNMNIMDSLTLSSSAQVYGDIHTCSLVIERGARVSGKIEMSAQ
ncbi:MAG: polymer-forming cytoskeletal protein [Oscillospiraceae bacterium]|nr:polymer-forming cytoskeletal protein [Oscillospiraceae bacterium]